MNADAREVCRHYSGEFERLRDRLPGEWMRPRREAALRDFLAAGIPQSRAEEWRYTDTGAIAQCPFVVAGAPDEPPAPAAEAERMRAAAGLCPRELVSVNGRFCPRLSAADAAGNGAAAGIECGSLAERLRQPAGFVADHLGSCLDSPHAFALLNTAFLSDGVCLRVPARQRAAPVHLLHFDLAGDGLLAVHPRNLIVLEEGAEAVLVESYHALGRGRHLCNAVTEAILRPGAKLSHYQVQEGGEGNFHMGDVYVRQEERSSYRSWTLSRGAAIGRRKLHVNLAGSEAQATLYGLYAVDGRRHLDCRTQVDHRSPRTRSDQTFLGLIRDRGASAFSGRVVIHARAQKTEARQKNANLLLSAQARARTEPNLEIHADDVQCSHSATVGRLDQDALFYLRTRALDEAAAERALTMAFAMQVLDKIEFEPLRTRMIAALPGMPARGRA